VATTTALDSADDRRDDRATNIRRRTHDGVPSEFRAGKDCAMSMRGFYGKRRFASDVGRDAHLRS
jgi:hypothetical protein